VIQRINEDRAWYFQAAGLVMLGLSGFLWWVRFRA
jgi:hypothetical protein